MREGGKQIDVLEALARGILIGGSVGLLGGLFFLDLNRALVLGLISGFFAALTRLKMKKKSLPQGDDHDV